MSRIAAVLLGLAAEAARPAARPAAPGRIDDSGPATATKGEGRA